MAGGGGEGAAGGGAGTADGVAEAPDVRRGICSNFGTPLIEEGHFRAVEAELKRIERERKTGKFAVSAPRAARRPCLSTLA